VKSIANELSSTATGSGPSGSSLALHRYPGMREDILAMAQDFERSHVSAGLGDCGEFRRVSCRNVAEGAEHN
jgi:hypothetical protein